ncbi:MAG: 2-succinyl-5-enolpyruvyl-6-hydroxy-3-cyclohexene-1-carboxylic-acid synthase [Bacteroidetes bacterium]|nr:2-succinyl-5-enolpyruvyl-6-hydroxy-3-cyclohexene-1-carboxylic-acid synthase [Bacteroidota bacterium]
MKKQLTSDKYSVHFLVENLISIGLKEVVISPGSRNAPLCIAFDEHPLIKCYLIHDERVAGFFAMGLSQASNLPVAVVCTSGSAVANYYPAVTEAFYQSIPLIVISADRPQEWINHGDGQTIMQENIFGNHVRAQLALSDNLSIKELENNVFEDLINLQEVMLGDWKGPVHINFALEEPLYNVVEPLAVKTIPKFIKKPLLDLPWNQLQSKWEGSKKKMILVGQLPPNRFVQLFLEEISNDPSIVVLVENTSNLKHQRFIHCIDRTLEGLGTSTDDYYPDLLITLGGAVVSKRIKAWLRSKPETMHWRVGSAFPEMNTYRLNKTSLTIEEVDFLRVAKNWKRFESSSFNQTWKSIDFSIQMKVEEYFANVPYSDLSVFHTLFDFIPEFSVLHLANSSVVRYSQLFDPISNVRYFSNRGTSGIDGSTSTACGFSAGSPEDWNVLITGDVSFFYDSNALWNQHLGPNLRIILINNGGGGIFKIIPGPGSTSQYLPYFVAEHAHSAKGICETFNIQYQRVDSINALEETLEMFWQFDREGLPQLIEIDTIDIANEEILKEFFQKIKPA